MTTTESKTIGLFGLGAFGQLMARHLGIYHNLKIYDPSPIAMDYAREKDLAVASLEEAAACDTVILGAPIPKMRDLITSVSKHIKPGALVMDVCSVKVKPALWMKLGLPDHCDIVATHPLFGPQSAPHEIRGQRIAVCPVRISEERAERLIGFLRDKLELKVLRTSPEEHDYEVAHIQGLTHMIARILVEMEPLPHTMTTKSYDKLMEAVEIVRYNSMELFLSIERENPFASDVHQKFFRKVEELRQFLRTHDAWDTNG